MDSSVNNLSSSWNSEVTCLRPVGHQGRDPITSLLKQHFYWPGIDAFVKEKV